MDLDDKPPALAPIENLPPLEVELPLEVVNHKPAPASLCLVCMTALTIYSVEQLIILTCEHGWVCGICFVGRLQLCMCHVSNSTCDVLKNSLCINIQYNSVSSKE
ncbi:hypothetical protein QTP88_023476 [Uroleucon formosanum]